MIELLFVRHGQTDWNLERRLQGIIDIPLNATGREEAEGLGKNFDFTINGIYSSDLSRAYETAEIITRGYNLPITKDKRLRERDFGKLSGKDIEFSRSVNRDLYGLEPIPSVNSRLEHFLGDMSKLDSGSYLVATHGGVISGILSLLTNGEIHWKTHPIKNCSLTSLTYHGNNWRINYFGKVFHEENLTKESICN